VCREPATSSSAAAIGFEIVDMDGNRVDRVLVTLGRSPSASAE
jgi:hypothetical protein